MSYCGVLSQTYPVQAQSEAFRQNRQAALCKLLERREIVSG